MPATWDAEHLANEIQIRSGGIGSNVCAIDVKLLASDWPIWSPTASVKARALAPGDVW